MKRTVFVGALVGALAAINWLVPGGGFPAPPRALARVSFVDAWLFQRRYADGQEDKTRESLVVIILNAILMREFRHRHLPISALNAHATRFLQPFH